MRAVLDIIDQVAASGRPAMISQCADDEQREAILAGSFA